MQGYIPGQWGSSVLWQESVVELRLASCGLNSVLPNPWLMHNLTHLDLSDNFLTGNPTVVITSKLEYLDLSNNMGLVGSWQAVDWAAMTSLSVLRLSNIFNFTGYFPPGRWLLAAGTHAHPVFVSFIRHSTCSSCKRLNATQHQPHLQAITNKT
jgi:hypothetical protein